MTNPSSGLSQPVRRVNPRPPSRERASPASPNCPTNAASFPNCPNQCGESPHAPPNSGRVSFASPNFAANCAQNKNSTALTIGNEGIQIQWPSRAHTRKHEAALPPVLRLKTKPTGISWVLYFFLDRMYKKWYNKAAS